MSIASSCSATIVEVEQSAEPLPALDRRIAVGRSHRLFSRHEQPVTDALVVPLAVVVRDKFRHGTPQVAFTKGHQLAQALRFIESTNLQIRMPRQARSLGERHLRLAISEFVEHYHLERNHQGLDNRLITAVAAPANDNVDLAAPIARRERLGGILSYYSRRAV